MNPQLKLYMTVAGESLGMPQQLLQDRLGTSVILKVHTNRQIYMWSRPSPNFPTFYN